MEQTSAANTDIEHMQAVTLSRQYGSGGGEIATRLARVLGWKLVDHEAVVQVAQELGISVEDAEAWDEHGESLGMRLLNGLSLLQPATANAMQTIAVPNDPIYHEVMRSVITEALTTGHVVIVGRGSQVLLNERRDILHVRVVAPPEQRITYVMQREGLSHEEAQARVNYKDNGRARYLQAQYHQDPSNPLLYDLVINTAILSLDSAVQLIRTALADKASQLNRPETQLGPGAGLPQYPGHSQDFGVRSDDKLTETT
jgi:cytidylate kinase